MDAMRAPQGLGSSIARWAIAVVLGVIGIILLIGGIWLVVDGGSPYYLLAGAGLIGSAVLWIRANRWAAWLYVAVFALTVPWALWESGADPWALVPRLVGPSILLALVALFSPFLDLRTRWPVALLSAVGALAFLGVVLEGAALAEPGWMQSPLPGASQNLGGALAFAVAKDWPAWGGTQAGERYSTLAQITPQNVSKLELAWVAHTRDLPSGIAAKKYAAESTPIKIGDRLYLCSAMDIIIALDARNGQEIWRYDPRASKAAIPYSATCRGVTAYRRGEQGSAIDRPATPGAPAKPCDLRIIEGTIDGRLIAVDAQDGKPCADFGLNGQVDLKQGMGTVYPGMVSVTSAPVIVRGNVIAGHQVLDGQMRSAPSGVIQAFNAQTGAFAWAWDLGRPGQYTPPAPGQEYTRGTPNSWTSPTADEQLGLVYLPMGNSADDYLSSSRNSQENTFSSSLVALDAATGHPVWHFQTVRNDVWDYDLGSQVSLVNLPNGTPALVLPSKEGDIYVLDRRTGQPLHGVSEMQAPTGGVEPGARSPTQPRSDFATLRKPPLTERDMWGMSPIDQMICRIQFREASYKGIFTAPTADRWWVEYPGYNGGADWGSAAIDPVRGVIVANYNDMPNYNRLIPRDKAKGKAWQPRGPQGNTGYSPDGPNPQAGVPYGIFVNAGWKLGLTGLLCKEPPYGGVRAINLATGKTIWDRPLGSARANGPWGIHSGLPFEIGTPNNGGSVVTAGGLIFIAATTDDLIRAIDIRNGKTVWTAKLPGGGQANVMTYEEDGRQYVVVMAGGHHFMNTPVTDQLVAYALPRPS